MKTLLNGNSHKDLSELSLTKIKLMLQKVAGMIPKTIDILILITLLVICKDLIKFQKIKKPSQHLASIISLELLVMMLLNTLLELSLLISKGTSSLTPASIIPTLI
jgi:hypothetical protein